MKLPSTQLSVIVTYRDDEAVVGTAVRRLMEWLQGQERSFEVVVVNDDSHDNSSAVMRILRQEFPALALVVSPGRGRGLATGVAAARGATIVFVTPIAAATRSLAPLERGITEVETGEAIAAADNHFVACRCNKALEAIKIYLAPSRGWRQYAEFAVARVSRIKQPQVKNVLRLLNLDTVSTKL